MYLNRKNINSNILCFEYKESKDKIIINIYIYILQLKIQTY